MHYSEAKLVPIFAKNGIMPEYYKPPSFHVIQKPCVEEEVVVLCLVWNPLVIASKASRRPVPADAAAEHCLALAGPPLQVDVVEILHSVAEAEEDGLNGLVVDLPALHVVDEGWPVAVAMYVRTILLVTCGFLFC